jgi:hypothetical protein
LLPSPILALLLLLLFLLLLWLLQHYISTGLQQGGTSQR